MGMRLLPISCSLLSCWCIVSFFSSTSPFDRRRLALNCAHTERVCSCFFLVFSNSVFNIFTSSSTFIFAIPTSLTWLASDRDSTSNSSLSLNTSAVEERKASSSRAVLLKFSSIDFAFLSTMSFSTCASRRWPFITLMSCDSRSTSRFHPCISSPSLTPIAAFSFLNIIASCSALNTFSLSLFICLTVITCLVSANRLEVDPPPLLLFVGIVRARREEETSDCCLAGIIFARTVDHPRFVPSPPSDTASPPVLSCCDSSSRTLFVPSSPSPSPPPPPFASLILSTPCEVRSLATPPPPPFLLPSSSRFISTSSWPGRVGLGCFSFFPSLSLSLPLSL
mmetsp:Transcript_6563/g.16321  ORF Transcript_6563/g.16321 Transcript_6563/m.16321 type:complete len:337 (-) Transcript_6563:782-1792(-)